MNQCYPHWYNTLPKANGTPFAYREDWVWNRTGATLAPGQIIAYDTSMSTAAEGTPNKAGLLLPAVTNWKHDDDGSVWRNGVLMQAQEFSQYTWAVMALEATPNREKARVLVMGEVNAKMVGTQNTAIPAGRFIICQPADLKLYLASANKFERKLGIMLEAHTFANVASPYEAVNIAFNAFGF